MSDDHQLLQRYAEAGDEAAFAELVRRHVNLVHSAALRQVNGDVHLAADVTQLVFRDLARKARALIGHRVLAGWLFTSTRFTAAKLVRSERRRRTREREAQLMHELKDDSAAQDWNRVRPVLDEALAELKDGEREAILLRYFEGRDFGEVGARLSLNANAARMRVERALEKLHALLARRGVTSTTAALAAALGAHAVAAAPAGLAVSVTGAALAGGGAAVATFMGMTKLQLGLAAVIAAGGTTAFVVQADANAGLRARATELAQANAAVAALTAENTRLARRANEIEDLRGDDAALAQLRDQAAALQAKLRALAAAPTLADAGPSGGAGSALGEVLDMRNVDRLPKPVFQTRPVYPAELRSQGVSGDVVLEFIVDTNGAVQNVRAVKSSRSEFEGPASEAVAKWKFDAGRKSGRTVNTRMQVPIVFMADGASTSGTPQPKGATTLRPSTWF